MATLREESGGFLDYLQDWTEALKTVPLAEIVTEAGGAQHVGIFCVDVINGFCHEGPLASPRVRNIIAPIAALFTNAYEAGIRDFVLTHDAHDANATEFQSYPPHCVRGTHESEIVPELLMLPFASAYQRIPKNSISSSVGTNLDAWLDAHPQLTHQIVVGDCTDLCTYQLAMHLKLRANAANLSISVILPADCVDTFDIPLAVAQSANILPHPADFFHVTFLYTMAQNGVRVVQALL